MHEQRPSYDMSRNQRARETRPACVVGTWHDEREGDESERDDIYIYIYIYIYIIICAEVAH